MTVTENKPPQTAIATREAQERRIANLSVTNGAFTPEQVQVIRDTIAVGASPAELQMFIAVCGRTGFDPFTKQIHYVKRWDAKAGREVGAIQVGIDGYRLIAERSGKYAGQDPPEWCGPDGVWKELWLHDEPPAMARVKVYRKDFERPVIGMARWSAYVQTTKDKQTCEKRPNSMWQQRGPEQLAKCAEAQAHRMAFPHELADLQVDGVESDPGPRDARLAHGRLIGGGGVQADAARSSAEALDDAMENGGGDEGDPGVEAGDATSSPAADDGEATTEISVAEFTATCKRAKNVLNREMLKEAPRGSGHWFFMDMVTINATIREDEIPGTVHVSTGEAQVIPQDRLERLYLSLREQMARAEQRTA